MKLPFVSLFKKQAPKDYFLAFLLRDEQVNAVVFEQIDGKIQVIGIGKALLPTSIETTSDSQLLDAADKAISDAESSLPDGVQTHRTVFGVKESWVEETRIKKEYLDRLKELSRALDLQPIGFLVFPEAIAHLLQKEEGAPVSGILVESGQKKVTVTLMRAGRIIQTREAPIEESLAHTVETALHTFTDVEIFPSRIILFCSTNPHLEATFINHHWNKHLPFLHVPQVTTLAADFDTRAILFGTATQLGLDAIDLVKNQPLKKTIAPTPAFEDSEESSSEQETGKQEEEPEEQPEEENFSHVTQSEESEETQEEPSDYFGFIKDEDIAKNAPLIHHPSDYSSEEMDTIAQDIPEEVKEEEERLPIGMSISGFALVEGAKRIVQKLLRSLPKKLNFASVSHALPEPDFLRKTNKLLLLVPVAVILIILVFVWMVFGLHATVALQLSPKVITKDQTVTFSTNQPTDMSSDVIGAQSISADENGKVTVQATGTKDIGDKAKGTVTIFNNDTTPQTLSSGTTIVSDNGLKFTLDQSVQVASASSDPFTGTKPATADVPVTATDIGTDYNLPSQTKFTVNGYSNIAAKNANAFSGGSKKTVTVVSSKDESAAEDQLVKNLTDQAKNDLQKQASGDTVILPDFTNTTLSGKSLDHQVGETADSLTLSATVTFDSVSYKKTDIDAYAKSVMQNQIPQNLVLAPQGVTFSVNNLTIKDGSAKADVTMKAALIPSINTTDLAKQISGRSFTQAQNILSGVPQYATADIKLSPNLFFLPQALPRIPSNITITLVTQ